MIRRSIVEIGGRAAAIPETVSGFVAVRSRGGHLPELNPASRAYPSAPATWPADSVPGAGRYRGDCAHTLRRRGCIVVGRMGSRRVGIMVGQGGIRIRDVARKLVRCYGAVKNRAIRFCACSRPVEAIGRGMDVEKTTEEMFAAAVRELARLETGGNR